jgi:iron complex outermembrane recepter protein
MMIGAYMDKTRAILVPRKWLNRIGITILLLLAGVNAILAQSLISGKITDASTQKPVSGAYILVGGQMGSVSDDMGKYRVKLSDPGTYLLEFSCIGYEKVVKEIKVGAKEEITIDISLPQSDFDLDEVIISATKTENYARNVPTRVNNISPLQVKALPVQYPDEYLQYLPGVYDSRPFGIFSSKATVSMRGLNGQEQGRVLALLDGIPINKADGGSVNWNLIYTGDIDRIEVVKGPGSSLYGGNAMGGTVNIISRRPVRPLEGRVGLKYGTFNTYGGDLVLSGKLADSLNRGFYWGLSSYYLQSDGYITQSEADQQANPYIVKSNMKEWSAGGKMGYDLGKNNYIELNGLYFNDRQGTGEQVYQPEGNTTDHDTYHIRGTYHGEKGKSGWNLNLYYLNEDYKRVNEYMRDDYTWYNVLSERVDYGGLGTYTCLLSQHHRLTGGMDLKHGGVDAQDVYYTSTDVVYNNGKMNTLGLFAQDEMNFFKERVKVIAGLRYDLAHYYDGAFTIENPSGETAFMWQYQSDSLEEDTWDAISPKLAVQYNFTADNRVYISYARGFRPSVLDDLCRSGRVKGGFKVANPQLGPEYLNNIEVGADWKFFDKLMASASIYFSKGLDFIYYVNSGDSIDMGYGLRPIFMPENITGVNIFGTEFEVYYDVIPGIRLMANYAHAHSEISDYEPGASGNTVDLTGNYLSDVPVHMAAVTATWTNKIVNACLAVKYTGKRWVNDQNAYDEIVGSDQYPAYTTVDVKVWKDFRHWYAELNAQNIFDVKFYDSKGAVCPGRFITLEVGARL